MRFNQPTKNMKNSISRGMKLSEGNKICDNTRELLSNGTLPHQQDAHYNQLWIYIRSSPFKGHSNKRYFTKYG